MGIPSYFSYIVKNHNNIIIKLNKLNKNIDNLYLDSNSIIYDSMRLLEFNGNNLKYETQLINIICNKIKEYITIVQPSNRVIIAFDGVAPLAKLEQQRIRRYKSMVEQKILNHNSSWDKRAITPGTSFMNKLNTQVSRFFSENTRASLSVNQIIVSGSDINGEGEHKLFQYIRNNESSHKHQTTLIYGLDADLIMLALNHLPISKNIYLYRETPDFIKYIDNSLNPNESYILNIPQMSNAIISTMNNGKPVNNKQQSNRLYDYIFICFLLGNDFLPHFPSVNIRTNGIHILINAYKSTIGKSNSNLTDGNKIFWNNLFKFIKVLSQNEYDNFKNEYKIREKMEKRSFTDPQERYLNIPIKNRSIERYINPYDNGWENRYYNSLFNNNKNDYFVKKVCINYLEGLEWVMKYYTNNCPDWRWCYKFNYPPLFNDLIKYIPKWDLDMIEDNLNKPIHPYTQLAYVLPKDSLDLLPKHIYRELMFKKHHYYSNNSKFIWAYCKYIWESHVELPHIDIDELESFIENIKN
tara:strand:+ start:5228 stop:6802 length:1575 start_codon:yes stop_codon:yes gene_type:complete